MTGLIVGIVMPRPARAVAGEARETDSAHYVYLDGPLGGLLERLLRLA